MLVVLRTRGARIVDDGEDDAEDDAGVDAEGLDGHKGQDEDDELLREKLTTSEARRTGGVVNGLEIATRSVVRELYRSRRGPRLFSPSP